ncbi:sugar ABC transporter ATP-binding protein [Georgenia alba]|uniref:Sugar ABC transporter ATP-binding protein n=1 Tax=Georgenia alba TaxID=2233858 RepID=A0ABW2Q8M2_9MICO
MDDRTASAAVPRLRMEGIVKRFGGVQALAGADLTVGRGEVLALLGENGAGKSTLMNVLSGVVTPDSGTVEVDGEVRRFHGPGDAQRAGVAMIHQELDLVPQGSVASNLFLGDEPRTALGVVSRSAMRTQATELLSDLGIDIDPDVQVQELRVGEQQMVAIAKALRLDARILVMDEPTSALTESEVRTLFALLPALRRQGMATIYISHRLDEITEVADRATILRDGRTVGTVSLGRATDPSEVIRLMIGRAVEEVFPERPPPGEDVRLAVTGLSVPRHPLSGRREPAGIDLTVRRGEILGLAGLLGSGRTELLEALYGLAGERATGSVEIDGERVRITAPSVALRLGIGFVPEDRRAAGLVMQQPVGANILLSVLRRLSRRGLRNRRAERARVRESVDRLRIKTRSADAIVATLSGGNQQKVVFARNLLRDPRILLLDEPTRGVDIGAKSEIYHLLARLAADGLSVVVASSEVGELVGLCDRIAVLRGGRVVDVVDRADADEESILAAAALPRGLESPEEVA